MPNNNPNPKIKNNLGHKAPTSNVNKLSLDWEERIKLHLEKEESFNKWRANVFKENDGSIPAAEGEEESEPTE